VAEGYRLAGADFPAMGEHWVHPGLLFRAVFDPGQPTILSYVTVGGRRVLAGVSWALPLAPGESPPAFPSPDAWHAHAGTLGDAILAAAHAGHPGGSGWRLAVLHAWIWQENPAGTFTTDNWRLPWLRAGHQPPPGASRAAAAGLSLVTTPEFYAELVALTHGDFGGRGGLSAAVAAAQAEAAAARDILTVAPERGAAALARAWSRVEPLLVNARRGEMLP